MDSTVWTNSGSDGNWSDASNWWPNVPTSQDLAWVNKGLANISDNTTISVGGIALGTVEPAGVIGNNFSNMSYLFTENINIASPIITPLADGHDTYAAIDLDNSTNLGLSGNIWTFGTESNSSHLIIIGGSEGGPSTFENTGTIVNSGGSTNIVDNLIDFINNGIFIQGSGGGNSSSKIDSQVDGTGNFFVEGTNDTPVATTIEFGNAVGSGQTIDFGSWKTPGTVQIDDPSAFLATVKFDPGEFGQTGQLYFPTVNAVSQAYFDGNGNLDLLTIPGILGASIKVGSGSLPSQDITLSHPNSGGTMVTVQT